MSTLSGCALHAPRSTTSAHLNQSTASAQRIPDIIYQGVFPPRPHPAPAVDKYSIEVQQVPLRELLHSLGHDAPFTLEIDPAITGEVTLSAQSQPLPDLLQRIARLHRLRLDDIPGGFHIRPDTPYLRHYQVDYPNIQRHISTAISSHNQITGGGSANTGNTPLSNSGNGSISSTRIDSSSQHHFWATLEKNIQDILGEADKSLPEGSSETLVEQNRTQEGLVSALPKTSKSRLHNQNLLNAPLTSHGEHSLPPLSGQTLRLNGNTNVRHHTFREANHVIIHPETGVLSIRATQSQHHSIAEYLHRMGQSARRQLMLEATIVEVQLTDMYKQGIDWSRLRSDDSGFSVTRPSGGSLGDSAGNAFALRMQRAGNPLNLLAAIDLLASFGNTKVLSSPRMSVMNNQTALLKVVENIVYFNVKSDTTSSANTGTSTSVTSTPQSVSVGLVLSVTPQISDQGLVTLNVRPTISSVSGWKQDPNPGNKVPNFVPQIRTREIESVLRLQHGEIAVLGGLMEDGIDIQNNHLPLLGRVPVAGELVSQRDHSSRKSELVIFLRPIMQDMPTVPESRPISPPETPFFSTGVRS